ncbi:MAG: patatin-like phospholipase family protein [Nannocystales bacterium]
MQRAAWLEESPFTLMLSAGFFGFFSHTGLLRALEDHGLRPQRVIGCSAGSLAGGLWASGMEAGTLADELVSLRREDFWDPGLPLGGLLRGRKFREHLGLLLGRLGVERIEQTPLRFSPIVHDVLRRKPVALNEGLLSEAIVASCTVPVMFRPVLSQGRVLVDGGVSDRSGFTALDGDERVLLHFLPSRRKVKWGAPAPVPTEVPGAQSLLLVTPDLPKVTPFRLEQGALAYTRTYEHAQRWLGETV